MSLISSLTHRWEDGKNYVAYCTDFKSSFLLRLCYISRPIYRALNKSNLFPVTVNLTLLGYKFSHRIEYSYEFRLLHDLFIKHTYECQLSNPKTIIDLGANLGFTTIYFARRYPDATIYAIEANPEMYKKLTNNVKNLPNVKIFNYAITNQNGHINFYADRNKPDCGSIYKNDSDSNVSFSVQSKTLRSFMAENQIAEVDLLKFDVEGAEATIFKDPYSISNINHLIGEIHYGMMDMSEPEFLALFKDFNYIVREKLGPNEIAEFIRT
jgi:FkbM family methyltransferase